MHHSTILAGFGVELHTTTAGRATPFAGAITDARQPAGQGAIANHWRPVVDEERGRCIASKRAQRVPPYICSVVECVLFLRSDGAPRRAASGWDGQAGRFTIHPPDGHREIPTPPL